jgi:hypothetical protein
MPRRPDSFSGSIGPCAGGVDSPCAIPLASTRKENPVWEGCEVTRIKTDLRIEGVTSVVTVTIGVKNNGKEAVGGFLIPIQPTTAAISFGVDPDPFDILGLRFEAIRPGEEVQATGEFRIAGKPNALWVGIQL